ncbi:MAG: prephenate/arogenate dehydrogenase family protein [Alphaproteobacteria bacterium]|jgi:cyclohexadieny/prephenate dehydrogenase|nr:prephenate/arogenate dehydrogenase family protein [Alphaproteobacteria bacterium]
MTGSDHPPLFERICLIGAGLIGSSLARVVRRDGLAGHISVAARSQATLNTMTDLGLADSTTINAAEAVRDADLVVLCTPLGAYEAIAKTIGPALKPGAIVSDVGSCKEVMFTDVAPHLVDGVHMVPCHPVAGTEHSGPEAGFAKLFDGHWCILTPGPDADAAAVDRVTRLWRACAMDVEIMTAAHHDHVLALTSHLPHLIAYSIVGTANDLEDDLKKEVIKFSASGFRDFTRIAASDPVMWRDILLKNSDAVLDVLGRFTEDLTSLQRAIRRGEGDKLEDHFTRTRAIRRGVIDAKQDVIDAKQE